VGAHLAAGPSSVRSVRAASGEPLGLALEVVAAAQPGEACGGVLAIGDHDAADATGVATAEPRTPHGIICAPLTGGSCSISTDMARWRGGLFVLV
jgi:hypothetical protein